MSGWNPFRKDHPFHYPGQELRAHQRVGRRPPSVMLEGETKRAVETSRTRVLVAAGLFAVVFLAIGGRLVDLMVLKAQDDPSFARRSTSAAEAVLARADITDRNGVVLATNLPTVNLYADATKIVDLDEAADKLAMVLPHLKRQEVYEKLSSGRRFVYIERNLTPRQQADVNAEGVPGIYFEQSERRAYLHGALASHILGATDPDNNGIAGTELTFDKRLKESDEPLRLSIDMRVQHAVRDTLVRSMQHFKAIGATGIVLDAKTGEILAMASLPDYDPENFGSADADARFNRATLGVYEMGSTFKLFNTAMALDSGRIRLSDTYDTTQPLRIARFTIRDSHPEDRWLSVPEILVHSSNIGSARMAVQLGAEHQKKFLSDLGLLQPISTELPEKGSPLYPTQWREISTMTISFGHGIAVTPVHLARAVAATINGGILRPTTLLADNVQEGKQVISDRTSDYMRKLMRLIVTDGTAKKADVAGYRVGAKTGTAEKISATGGYDRGKLRTTLAAAFPMDDPKYVVLTVLDEPARLKSTYGFATAGWNAAPTAGEIIGAVAPLLGVFPRVEEKPSEDVVAGMLQGLPSSYLQAATHTAGSPGALNASR